MPTVPPRRNRGVAAPDSLHSTCVGETAMVSGLFGGEVPWCNAHSTHNIT